MPFQRVKTPKVRLAGPGEPVGQKDKQNLKPTNERLWHMLTMQARAKFAKWPSPTASAWVHKKYVQMGGKFVDTAKESAHKKAVKAAQEIAAKHHHKGKK